MCPLFLSVSIFFFFTKALIKCFGFHSDFFLLFFKIFFFFMFIMKSLGILYELQILSSDDIAKYAVG